MRYRVAVDVEGPVVSPSVDFAWKLLERLYERGKLSEEELELVKHFDAYDDWRWEVERSRKGWSTGTTPLVAQLYVSCFLKFPSIFNLGKKLSRKLTPGSKEFVKGLMEMGCEVYLVSNSFAGMVLSVAKTLGVKFENAFSSGYNFKERVRKDLYQESWERFPFEGTMEERGRVKQIVRNWLSEEFLPSCKSAVEQKNATSTLPTEVLLRSLEKLPKKVFQEVYDAFFAQTTVMGGHNKARVVEKLSCEIFEGDSIVDADAIAYASRLATCGIASNCTDKFSLRECSFNVCYLDASYKLPVYEDVLRKGKIRVDEWKKELESSEFRIFGRKEIERNFGKVIEVNRKFKEMLKGKG